MKKHFFKIFFFLVGIALFSSCMKDDPENNKTVYYGYQQIPNINEYMPQDLLCAMDTMGHLYYGDEPPRIEGLYIADSIYRTKTYITPSSLWEHAYTGYFQDLMYFQFYEQHKCISKTSFKARRVGTPQDETSETESTYELMKNNEERFLNDTIAPSYFAGNQYSVDVFRNAYIIGHDQFFTAYYYEIRDNINQALPMNAVIISGCIDQEIIIRTDTINHTSDTIEVPVIKDMVWGVKTMLFHKEEVLQDFHYEYLANAGDIQIFENKRPAQCR